jgi:TetR/AcrR family transcriptional regulator
MLTKRLVTRRRDAAPRDRSRSRRQAPRRSAADPGTRDRLFAAAASEFAARGFAGANVDRIAGAARVNKAMIYYHFSSKAALYQEILGDMFHAVAARVRTVAASDDPPEAQLAGFVDAIASEAEARPHFPPIWFREVAEGGVHLAEGTVADIADIVRSLVAILQHGVRAGRFRRVEPLLVHGGIVGPLLLYFASAGLRRKLARAGIPAAERFTREDVVAQVQKMTLGFVQGKV